MRCEREPDSDLERGFEPLRTLFAVLVLLLGFAASARAEGGFGTLAATAADGRRFELVALDTEVRYQVSGLVAEAAIRQRFSNRSEQWIEAQYVLPLSAGAAVHDLELHVGERRIVGEVREKEAARAAYVEAAAEGRRAALVESSGEQLFRTAVANVAPGETIEVDVRWSQEIRYRDARFGFVLPLTFTPRYGDATGTATSGVARAEAAAPDVSVHVTLDAGFDIARLDSPSHAIDVDVRGTRHVITLAAGKVRADRDFVLEWTPRLGAAPTAAVLTERDGADTYALLMLLPRAELADPLPRELILVIDTSGSMLGESLEQARAAVDLALASLRPTDRFNVIRFESTTEALFEHAVAATPSDVRLAREWVAGLSANGGTEMAAALERALGDAPEPGSVRQVVFATDGAVEGTGALYALIDRMLGASRLFPIGIGSAPNGTFIERADTLGRGKATLIRDTGEVGLRMRELFDTLDRPALRDLELAWPVAAEVAPAKLPDLYAGEPLLVVARLAGAASGQVEARGVLATAPWSTSLPLARHVEAAGIARLWARRRIDSLEQSLDLGADPLEVRERVLELAQAQHLVTRYTSLVAVEQVVARPDAADLASWRVANAAPAGTLAFAATATSAPRGLAFGLGLLFLAALLRGRRRPAQGAEPCRFDGRRSERIDVPCVPRVLQEQGNLP